MLLTKYGHACLVIEENNKTLVIDPGNLSNDFVVPNDTVAVIITHAHPDHLDAEKLQTIVANNSEVVLVGHEDTIGGLNMAPTHFVKSGDAFDVGPFHLEFFGEKHEVFHSSLPVVANLGVMINNTLYYPGDSYTLPNKPVDTLALPLSGPWLKTGDAIDFALTVKPNRAFSTHDAHLSDEGKRLVDTYVPMLTEKAGIQYFRVTDPTEI